MARLPRQVPVVYFGRPGALVSMPWPRGDVDRPLGKQVFEFASGTGQYMVSSLSAGARQFTLAWKALHIDSYNKIDQYWQNGLGVGPWAFIDPSQPNLLLPNIASATNLLCTTAGFTTSDGLAASGALLSSSAFVQKAGGIRALQWVFASAAATAPTLWLGSPFRNWIGYPVAPNLPYTFSCYGRPDGTIDTSIQVSVRLQWFDSSSAQIGSDVSGGTATLTGAYSALSVTGTAPSNAAYVRPIVVAVGSTITTGASIYLDSFQLEQDSAVNPWAQGSGSRPVEITSFSDTVPFDTRFRTSATLVLRELVP